jgi:transaldolase
MNKNSYFHRLQEQTPTRFWINNVTREQANLALEAGSVGCTQNPSYTLKMLEDPKESEYTYELLDGILRTEKDDNEVMVKLQRELVAGIACMFKPMYEESCGTQGFVSIQGDPFREDRDTIVRHARYNCEAGSNIMAKIPVTKDGLEAIEILAAERIPINATEVMAVKQALDVCEVYVKATKGLKNPAPIYFSHIAGIYDEYLQNLADREKIDISSDAMWQAGISIAKKVHRIVREKAYPVGFIGGGARGLHHFTEMVGADACITINWNGAAELLIEQNPPVVQRFLQATPESVVDELLEKLEDYRRGYLINGISVDEYEEFGPVVHFRHMFEKAWANALEIVKKRRETLGL